MRLLDRGRAQADLLQYYVKNVTRVQSLPQCVTRPTLITSPNSTLQRVRRSERLHRVYASPRQRKVRSAPPRRPLESANLNTVQLGDAPCITQTLDCVMHGASPDAHPLEPAPSSSKRIPLVGARTTPPPSSRRETPPWEMGMPVSGDCCPRLGAADIGSFDARVRLLGNSNHEEMPVKASPRDAGGQGAVLKGDLLGQ